MTDTDIDIALALPARVDDRWSLAAQVGVDQAVVHPSMSTAEGRRGETPWDYDGLLRMRNAFEDAGLEVAVIEGGWPLTDTTRLGKDGRDEELDQICDFIRAVGAVDIPVICYSWMTNFWWVRTTATRRTRGGALTTAYNDDQWQAGPEPEDAPVTEDHLWETLEYFLERVCPVAEEAGVKLALHPDDPPLSPSRGVARIARSVEAYDRIMSIYDGAANGICFCQGNFAAMGADIPDAIRRFDDRIHFVHFRDVEGTPEAFTETWQDDGPTDMLAAMRAYADIGFDGPMRPDHVPTMTGESNDRPGYHTMGRLFAVGYMRGLLEQVDS